MNSAEIEAAFKAAFLLSDDKLVEKMRYAFFKTSGSEDGCAHARAVFKEHRVVYSKSELTLFVSRMMGSKK